MESIHVWIREMDCIVAHRIHDESILGVHKSWMGANSVLDGMAGTAGTHSPCSKRRERWTSCHAWGSFVNEIASEAE